MANPEFGAFTYQDDYGQLYTCTWEKPDQSTVDYTSVVDQPYVWGEEPAVRVVAGVKYRRGIRTITRQIIRLDGVGGYEVVMEGGSQAVAWVRVSFACGDRPIDPFLYHLDQSMSDDVEAVVEDGPHLAYPGESGAYGSWAAVAGDGSMSGAGVGFVDVWN